MRRGRKSRSAFALGTVFAIAAGLLAIGGTSASAAAVPGLCQRDPRDAVAQLCADTATNMYGAFTTFSYPSVGHDSSAGNAYNATRFFTDDALGTSYELGLDVGWGSPTGQTTYRPYWVDYTPAYEYHAIGDFANQPDSRPHTFTSFPHCDGCKSWDLFYDFNFVGTTKDGKSATSHHVVTGWTIVTGAPGSITFPKTSNRVQWLNGNQVFERFVPAVITSRAPAGNCARGANPLFCFRFDTAATVAATGGIGSWDVTKPLVTPGAAAVSATRATENLAVVKRSPVDQDLLRRCVDADASQCLDTVPGLRDCVRRRLVCTDVPAPRPAFAPLTAADAAADAVEFLVAHQAVDAGTSTSVEETATETVVTVIGTVREFTGDRAAHDRAELRFDRSSHRLLSVSLS